MQLHFCIHQSRGHLVFALLEPSRWFLNTCCGLSSLPSALFQMRCSECMDPHLRSFSGSFLTPGGNPGSLARVSKPIANWPQSTSGVLLSKGFCSRPKHMGIFPCMFSSLGTIPSLCLPVKIYSSFKTLQNPPSSGKPSELTPCTVTFRIF